MSHPAFGRLPERLTVSFPLWLIYGAKGDSSPYYDIDKVMREHAERGFNCIRIDSGEGVSYIASYDCKQTELRQGIFPAFAYFIYLNH